MNKLKALSDAATPGPWMAVPGRLMIGDQEGPIMSYLRGDKGSPEGMKISLASERVADHHFVATLVNAYRAGELVAASDVQVDEGLVKQMFRARVGDSLEVLDAIREALAGQDKEQIIELVNGYIDRARADLERLK